MALDGFSRLYHDADARTTPARVAVAGGDDPTVLEAMRIACDCGWVRPVLFGSEPRSRPLPSRTRSTSTTSRSATPREPTIAAAAVAEVRSGGAQAP